MFKMHRFVSQYCFGVTSKSQAPLYICGTSTVELESMIVKLSASADLSFCALCGLGNINAATDFHIH